MRNSPQVNGSELREGVVEQCARETWPDAPAVSQALGEGGLHCIPGGHMGLWLKVSILNTVTYKPPRKHVC